MSTSEVYTRQGPSSQNAINIFDREWSSTFPAEYEVVTSGHAQLFQDHRAIWAVRELGGVSGFRVLELGPLEGAHSHFLEKVCGVRSVLAIEAHQRAYLKCLVVKEITGLRRCHFTFGDFVPYLKNTSRRFDLCFASGVLYHMENPVELLELIARVSDRVYLWTHYYDAKLISENPHMSDRFKSQSEVEFRSRKICLYQQQYNDDAAKFCGGPAPISNWMKRADILEVLSDLGFKRIVTSFEDPQHLHGPSFAVVATKRYELRSKLRKVIYKVSGGLL